MRVLVVDDLPHMRLLVRGVVEAAGFEVAGEAADGSEAVAQTDALRPDVIVMDWNMPVMMGVEATTRIKTEHPDIQVIAYTSTIDPDVERAFFDNGACDHVPKGDIDRLMKALEHCGAPQR